MHAPCIALRLREERERCHLTQDDLAEKVGITKTAISNFERGHNLPKLNTLLQLVEALQLPGVDTLLSDCCTIKRCRNKAEGVALCVSCPLAEQARPGGTIAHLKLAIADTRARVATRSWIIQHRLARLARTALALALAVLS